MKISIIILLSTFVLFPCYVFSQKQYLDASITTNDGQLIKGQVRAGSAINAYRFEFKEQDGKVKTYDVSQLTSFEVTRKEGDILYYERRAVEIEISPQRNNLLEIDNTPALKFERDTVWLELLYRGSWSLYFLLDKNGKSHYFLATPDGQPVELVNKIWRDGNRLRKVESFRKQLLDFSQDCPQMFSFISTLAFTRKQLLQAGKQYDECKNEKAVYVQTKEQGYFSGQIFGGYSFATLYYLTFKGKKISSPGGQVGLALEYFPGESQRNLSLFVSTSIHYFSSRLTDRYRPSDLEMSTIRYRNWLVNLNLLVSFRFNIHKAVKPLFRFGYCSRLALSEDFYAELHGTREVTDLSRIQDLKGPGFQAVTGLEYKKFGIELGFQDVFYKKIRRNSLSFFSLNLNYRLF